MTKAFSSEAEMCRLFLHIVAERERGRWTPYPETAGWDIVLVHESGVQIGIEAKIHLNAKVLIQATEDVPEIGKAGPDFRAVLVPTRSDLSVLARRLGVTVITVHPDTESSGGGRKMAGYNPGLPRLCRHHHGIWLDDWRREWIDHCPLERLRLPEYLPDVEAGHPSPLVLSCWKIAAIKLCLIAEARGVVDRATFKALNISASQWLDGHRFQRTDTRGVWRPNNLPTDELRLSHPRAFAEIKADFAVWSAAVPQVSDKESPQ